MNGPDWSAITSRVRTETFVCHIEQHAEIGSTNDRALLLAADAQLPTPAIVLTERQTAGRGRGANVWRSAPGAIAFSLVIERPAGLPRERMSLLSLAAGLATRDAIAAAARGHLVKVKWPNDVYLDGRKVCGILTEVPPARSERAVVGIGLNANNILEGAPPEMRDRAISIVEATGACSDLGDLLVAFLVQFETELAELAAAGALSVSRWSAHCLLTGRTVRLRTPAGETVGDCLGVAKDGALLLDAEHGTRAFHGGEVIAF